MGIMDKINDNTSDMSEMRDRYNELRDKEMRGELDDKGREELNDLREQLRGNDL